MTVEVAPRRSRKPKSAGEELAIGEINQTVFACPACTRPLVMGSRRCPSCGTRLIIGVQAKRAGILVAIGTVGGLMLGGVVSTAASALGGAIEHTVAAVTASSPSPSPSPSAVAPSDDPGPISTVPALTRSALSQAIGVSTRLTASKAVLASALKAKNLDAYGVSQTLRALSADAVIGLQLSPHIGAWAGGKSLSGELTPFYAAIQETASSGLSASIRNDKAYRAAGQRMIVLLGGLTALDAHLTDVSIEAGVLQVVPVESAAP